MPDHSHVTVAFQPQAGGGYAKPMDEEFYRRQRELMSRVVAGGKDPARTPVGQVMTEDPLTVAPNDSLETCMTLMKRHGFRHLPVCAGRELKGVVSLRDILLHDLDEKEDEMRMMRAYLHSTPDAG